jgi:hypothetical protein
MSSVYAALRDLHTVHGIAFVAQKSAIPVRTAPKPPPNLGPSLFFCDVQNSLPRELRMIQIVPKLGHSANKT